ncbi:MAG: Hcp family type VI secretion system effector [Terriglobia bacterium]
MAIDYYLKLDGVEGESQAAGHEKEIELLSWSWGASNPGSLHYGSGGGTGKASAQDFSCSLRIGKGSFNLVKFCSNGKHIASGILTARKTSGSGNPQDYLTITMTEVIISSFQTGGSGGDDVPIESISLNFAKFEYDYKVQSEDGKSMVSAGKATWDLAKGTTA